ncbi:MAG: DUF2207 domain-containing protein, partial [Bacteroidales bacterium]|nr:DUF2207 domain-containing protein [Bacteroidales bacterium]
ETGFSKKSIYVGCLFAVLAALFISFLPVFVPMRVSSHAFAPIYFVTIIPALLIFAFFAAIYATRHRNGKKLTVTFTAIASVYSIACVVLYCIFVPSGSFGLAPKIIASIITLAAEMFAASFVMRSDEYNEKLREVAEVREFILGTPRADMERILEKDPYVYYEFLPYALLLRIGIPWSDKFRGLTLSTPSWLVADENRLRFAAIRDTIKNTYDAILAQTVKPVTTNKKRR